MLTIIRVHKIFNEVINIISAIIKLIISAIVLLLVSAIVPGFSVAGFWGAIVASIVIIGLSYLVTMLFEKGISPYGRGFVSFLLSTIVLYFSQFIVSSIDMNFLGALLASFVIGIVDAFIPTQFR
jgi:putative membrane protein